MKMKWIIIACLGCVASGLFLCEGADAPRPTQFFMRQKLGYSQGILEGITLEKFDLVTKNALRLRNMSTTNLFLVMHNTEYLLQTTNFQKHVDALYQAGVDKNLPAATEAYTRVARSCVECHQYFRSVQHANPGAAK